MKNPATTWQIPETSHYNFGAVNLQLSRCKRPLLIIQHVYFGGPTGFWINHAKVILAWNLTHVWRQSSARKHVKFDRNRTHTIRKTVDYSYVRINKNNLKILIDNVRSSIDSNLIKYICVKLPRAPHGHYPNYVCVSNGKKLSLLLLSLRNRFRQ